MDNTFNLAAALSGAKIQTRCGFPARIVEHTINNLYTLAVIVTGCCGYEYLLKYNNYGKPVFNPDVTNEYEYDLVMVTEHKVKYINLLKNRQNGNVVASRLFDTEEEAKEFEYTNFDVIKTIKAEYDLWN